MQNYQNKLTFECRANERLRFFLPVEGEPKTQPFEKHYKIKNYMNKIITFKTQNTKILCKLKSIHQLFSILFQNLMKPRKSLSSNPIPKSQHPDQECQHNAPKYA